MTTQSKRRKRSIPPTKKRTTRVTVDFPVAQHRRLKAIAALEGVTLQDYIRSQVLAESEEKNISDSELKPIVKKIIKQNGAALKRLANK
jgi:macrodomain Ter protein organizer (MatP/YcbG family)